MKKLLEVSVAIKSVAAMVLAGQIILYLIVGSFFGLSGMDFFFIWQAIAVAVITAILQYIAFTEDVIKRMRYSLRLVVFSIPLYIILSAFAIIFGWFPLTISTWLLFTLVFLIIFGALNAAVEIYTKVTGKKLNESLDAYNRKNAL